MIVAKCLLSFLMLISAQPLFSSEEPTPPQRPNTPDEYVLQLDEFAFPENNNNRLSPTQKLIIDQFGGKPVINSQSRKKYLESLKNKACAPQTTSYPDPLCRKAEEYSDENNLTLHVFEHGTVVTGNDFPYVFPHEDNPDGFQLIIYNKQHEKDFGKLPLEARAELIEVLHKIPQVMDYLGLEHVLIGINGEKAGGASIPDHLHCHVWGIQSPKKINENYMLNNSKEYNPTLLQATIKQLKPLFENMQLPLHILPFPGAITQLNHPCSNKNCALCMIFNTKNDKEHGIVKRFNSVAVLFKPFAKYEGQLLVAPFNHTEGFNLSFIEKSEITELIAPLTNLLKTEFNTDGFNIEFRGKPYADNTCTHYHVEFLPRYANRGVGFVQATAGIELTEINQEELYNKVHKALETVSLQQHACAPENTKKEEQN